MKCKQTQKKNENVCKYYFIPKLAAHFVHVQDKYPLTHSEATEEL